MSQAPVVTGLSPIEGPPGTKVTIRGENLGEVPNDLIGLTICGCDCLLSAEWKSAKKIIARSGPGKGKGDVIVTTKRGGVGTCAVQFRGYHETIGPMKESAVWVEETPLFIWGRRSMSPSSYQHEDLLGLSVEGNEKKFPEDDLHELFPEKTGDITSENFSPEWCLLENYHVTTFNDLKHGLSFLQRKVKSQKEDQLSFLKANVGSVIDQVDTLKSLRDRFEEDKIKDGSEPTLKLEKAIKEAIHEANKLFDDVLMRKDRADATRSALNVLMRFKFLFCLPCAIDRNIKKGDYEIVINDYARVKNLFKKTDIRVFNKALGEIEKRISGLKNMLHEKLRQMPVSVEEQKRIIRYLVNLETEGDPAWDAILSHFKYISQRLKKCYEEHKAADGNLAEELTNSKNYSASKYAKNIVINDLQPVVPQSISFVEELCEIMSTSFPDLWKLGQAYFSKELHVKAEPGRSAAFKDKSLSTILRFCKTIRAAVIPHTLDKSVDRNEYGVWPGQEIDVIAPWLPTCLHCVRSTYGIFIKLDLPGDALDLLSNLILDLRLHSMTVLFKQAAEQIRALEKKETWKIEYSSNHTGITQTPIKFEQIIQDVIKHVRESVLISEQRESNLFDRSDARQHLEKQVDLLLQSYCTTLKNLAHQNRNSCDENHAPVVSQLIGSPVMYRADKLNAVPVWEQRLLTTLSNYNYTKNEILPKIPILFAKHGYPPITVPMDNTKSQLLALDKSIMETYLEQKSDPLVGTIEPSMYLGRFDWDTNIKPIYVRPYAKECINNLIGVYTEVNKVSPTLVKKVLTEVIEIVAEELSRLMSCVKKFSHCGTLQARTDILALQETLQNYITPKAKMFFDEALEAIPPLEKDENKIVEDILKQFRVRMKLQILCFH